jgi:TRAP-type C4-dicarboxylate transport system permease small subunit
MALLGKINTVLLKFASVAVMVSLAAIAIVIPYEVFCRYILNSMNTWSAEFCTYMLVWASMLGGAVGLRKGYHVGITTLMDSLSPRTARLLQMFIHILMLVFLSVMTYQGVVQSVANIKQTSSSMGISMSLPYAALPIGFFIMLATTLQQLLELFGNSSAGGN